MFDHERKQMVKLFDIKEDVYYLWNWVEQEPHWRLAIQTPYAREMDRYCSVSRDQYPNERIKIMKGSKTTLFDSQAKNYNKVKW